MGKIKKVGLISISASVLMLTTITAPAFAAQTAEKEVGITVNSNIRLSNIELDPKVALELSRVDYFALFGTVSSNLGINKQQKQPGQITTYGLKGMAAKVAAKQMINKLKNIGSRAWNEQIKQYIDKLPLTDNAKKNLKYYLSYQVLMEALNILIDFTGTAEDGLANALTRIGVPSYLADVASRAIVFFLL
ncbi:MAG: hypothetical protein WAW77_11980 [Caldibacillus thermoamylovorans]|uniref:hypothetical protein n=1 Tax=Caldifermentibacillus hisashii TaxID=996558 RepID=UPI003BDE781C